MKKENPKNQLSPEERSGLSDMIRGIKSDLRQAGKGPGWNSLEELESIIDKHLSEAPECLQKHLTNSEVNQEVWGAYHKIMYSIAKNRGAAEGQPNNGFDSYIADLDETSRAFVVNVKQREDQLRTDMDRLAVGQSLGDIMRARLMTKFHGNGGYGKRFSNPGWNYEMVAEETQKFAEERIKARLDQKSVDNQVAVMANDLAVHAVKSKSIQGLSNFDEIMKNAKKAAKVAKMTLANNGSSVKREKDSFSL